MLQPFKKISHKTKEFFRTLQLERTQKFLAERVGFEPTYRLLTDNSISSRARYGQLRYLSANAKVAIYRKAVVRASLFPACTRLFPFQGQDSSKLHGKHQKRTLLFPDLLQLNRTRNNFNVRYYSCCFHAAAHRAAATSKLPHRPTQRPCR